MLRIVPTCMPAISQLLDLIIRSCVACFNESCAIVNFQSGFPFVFAGREPETANEYLSKLVMITAKPDNT